MAVVSPTAETQPPRDWALQRPRGAEREEGTGTLRQRAIVLPANSAGVWERWDVIKQSGIKPGHQC